MNDPEEEIQHYFRRLGNEIDRVLMRYDRGEQGMPPDFTELPKSPSVQRYYEEISMKIEQMMDAYDRDQLKPVSFS
ncbi:MAG: hypothetical protein AABZ60_18755 [Planctomycetota bacterium]